MKTDTPTAVYLKDYRPPEFLVEESEMTLDLDFRETKVTTRYRVRRNDPQSSTVSFDIDSIAITAVRGEWF